MSDEESIDAKDLAVLVPLIASALAISWEVGRFAPFGGFYLFSISEHLLGAISSLPLAFLVAGTVVLSAAALKKILGPLLLRRSKTFNLILVGVIFPVTGLLFWLASEYSGVHQMRGPLLASSLVTGLLIFLYAIVIPGPLTGWSGLTGVFVGAIFLAYVNAAAFSFSALEDFGSLPANELAVVQLKQGTSKGVVVIMLGDRGLLFYDPLSRTTTFARLEDLVGLQWPR